MSIEEIDKEVSYLGILIKRILGSLEIIIIIIKIMG